GGGKKARHRCATAPARRIDAARMDTGLARGIERPGLASEHMEAEIGSIDFEGHLAHARVERIGRDRVRGLRRALEVDFAVAGKMSVRPHIALSENRETALARRETRFRCVEV